MAYTESDSFNSAFPFNISLRELVISTAAAMTIFLGLFGVSFAPAHDDMQTGAAMKSDRLAIGGEQACAGQAWGNWNDACLQALSGKDNLRLAPNRTVEFTDTNRNLTVLTRMPTQS
ncbi:hypothetical protein [Breoghania sp.]|uniref:hypothetical protein n=1 Tax=Breoghania sp. TaxID=2065378 RepID=UPI002AA7622B|nr:hypothetical protein [Breoghania sp.]